MKFDRRGCLVILCRKNPVNIADDKAQLMVLTCIYFDVVKLCEIIYIICLLDRWFVGNSAERAQ